MRQPIAVLHRRHVAFALWLTILALPILVLDNVPRTDARAALFADSKAVATVSTTAPPVIPLAPVAAPVVPPTTATTEPPPVTDPPSTTSTTEPAPAQTEAAAAPSSDSPSDNGGNSSDTGGASWYDYRSGECAHRTLPKGTVVTVTNLSTGASTTCTVTDRGPWSGSRIIDLDRDTFAAIADPGEGVIEVRIAW